MLVSLFLYLGLGLFSFFILGFLTKGNRSAVTVSGEGEFDCDAASISNKKGTYSCAMEPAAEKPVAEETAEN